MIRYKYYPKELYFRQFKTAGSRLDAFIDLHPLDIERFCLCRHKGLEVQIIAEENANNECSVYISIKDDDDYDKDFLVQCSNKQEMMQVFRYIVNEAIDLSGVQLNYDTIYNILTEFKKYFKIKVKFY